MKPFADIAVIGGGAAGLAAAIFCARRSGGARVCVFEKQARVGKKLLATGNGTCNISNIHADVTHYHGNDPSFAEYALGRFSPADASAFFSSVGVRTVIREDGRVYPLCAMASAVLDCLRMELDRLGVRVVCDETIGRILPQKNGVRLVGNNGTYDCSRVIVAAGGAASSSLGGCNDGYALLCGLGHTKTPLFPAIVQIRTEREAVKAVKGIRVDAALHLIRDGNRVAAAEGEILFADYGVSGPAAMMIGRHAADWERRKKGTLSLVIDVLPTLTAEQVNEEIDRRCRFNGMLLEDMLTGLLQKRLGQTLIKASGLSPLSRTAASLTEAEKTRLCRVLKGFTLEVVGSAGMNAAQVTAGGIATEEFDPETMRSLKNPNVFAVGEVLDIDGDCGGFNLQWAWSSAFVAATAATEDIV